MIPYYEEDGITLYCGDCRDILPQLPKVDLCLTDPPYGLNKKMSGGTWGKAYTDADMMIWDYLINPETMEMVIGSAKYSIIWGANHYTVNPSRCWLVWNKPHIPTLSDVELAWSNLDMPAKSFHENRQPQNGHPTEKPLTLFKWCIHLSATDGIIIDPFCGSGTTLVAAKQLGRKATGIEISEKYCEITVKRLAQMQISFTE